MNKLVTTLFLFLISFNLYAKAKPYLVCLGKEETYIHKEKIGGAFLKLNQDIISALIQLSDSTQMSKENLKRVCSKKFTSLEILKLMIESKEGVFFTTKNNTNIEQMTIDKHNLKELKEKVVFIFIDFLTKLQAQYDDPNCLFKHIPELKDFYYRLRYTLEEVGLDHVMSTLKDPEAIFKKIENLPKSKKC